MSGAVGWSDGVKKARSGGIAGVVEGDGRANRTACHPGATAVGGDKKVPKNRTKFYFILP